DITNLAAASKRQNIVDLLMRIKDAVRRTAADMVKAKVSTLEHYIAHRAQLAKVPTDPDPLNPQDPDMLRSDSMKAATAAHLHNNSLVLPDNAIFQNLSTSLPQAKLNVEILAKLGVSISEENMARISRIFLCRPSVLMEFVRNPHPQLDLYSVLDHADAEVSRGFSQRTGLSSGGPDSTSAITKLWSSLAPNLSSLVHYESVAEYLTMMLLEGNCFDSDVARPDLVLSARRVVSPRPATPTLGLGAVAGVAGAPPMSTTLQNQAKMGGVDAYILCRIIADTLVNSSWNRQEGVEGGDFSLLQSKLSFSGLDAYIRNNRIHFIERKLRYLMQLEANYSGSEVYMMVHVYVSHTQDEFVILAHDPLSGEVHKLGYQEALQLPLGEKLVSLFTRDKPSLVAYANSARCSNTGLFFYNPWDTPAEDAAVTGLVSRLKLVRSTGSASCLFIAEEPKFVASLKKLLDDSASLPFFCVANDTTMAFEVDDLSLTSASIRSFVFSKIRNYKSLYNFLVNVNSSLNVVLATYNGGIRETFKWREMLAHLTNYRNPFFTLQLLPAFLAPEEYVYRPSEDVSAFTGEEEETLSKKKSAVDKDGAPHPTWDAGFKFGFQPPQLTNCKVLSTEVVKLRIDGKFKYVVVMVRQAQKEVNRSKINFKFLTIYDPRNATDYQCGVEEGCALHALLYGDSDSDLGKFMEFLAEAADMGKLLLGPAITPRLVLHVYNECGRAQELLGSCEVSISSVLSGSGIGDKQWICLTYPTSLNDVHAGDIQLELRFRGQSEIEAERQSEENRQEKLRRRKELGVGGGDQDKPPTGGRG
ncbi:hypothetical protein B484DRAFT_401181, partial [Ochromonadaceae sp. CCMP2298]